MIRFIQGHVTVNLETDIATTFMQTEEFEEIVITAAYLDAVIERDKDELGTIKINHDHVTINVETDIAPMQTNMCEHVVLTAGYLDALIHLNKEIAKDIADHVESVNECNCAKCTVESVEQEAP